MTFKPLLAATLTNLEAVRYPVLASPKLDGIRCIVRGGVALSRKLKPIPNKFVQRMLGQCRFALDGEIMIDGKDYNAIQSAIMSEDGEPEFVYHVFDTLDNPNSPYRTRWNNIYATRFPLDFRMKKLQSRLIQSLEELLQYEQECIDLGYEGVMLRDPEGRYKHGRSTEREGILLKMKRFEDAEAEVIGFEERMHNGNELERDALGNAKRSAAKAGMIGRGDLGALIVRYTGSGQVFSVGSGFTDEQRREIWDNRDAYLGKMATIKYQEFSRYGVPRFSVFKGFRQD